MDKQVEILLINKISKNNKEAFKELFEHYYSRLCSYAEKFVVRKDIAEEIVQNVFFIIWDKRNELKIEISLKGYLFRSVHNNSIKYLQTKKIESDYFEHNKIFGQSQITEMNDFELMEAINQSIDELPEKCREIFMMSRLENLKHKEIAQKLNISEKTVEVQIRNANLRLRELLKDFK